jgi:GT2 family glycosyltransferase
MDLSVIIVNFNVRDYLQQCLNSVISASENINNEIIVVDNNSDDGSVEMIRAGFPGVNLIVNSHNCGFSAGNNQAIRKSAGRYILLLNPDTLLEKDTLTKCISFMEANTDAGALGVCMFDGEGKYLPESKRAFPSAGTAFFKIIGASFLFPESPILNRYYLPSVDKFQTSHTEVISGAFMFIRREALNKSGLLDEVFFMYGEDIDLSYRLLQTGYYNYYYPEAKIIHFKGKSTPRNNYTDIFNFYEAMSIYVRKRRNEGKFGSFCFFILAAIRLRESLAIIIRFLRLLSMKLFKRT